MATVRVSLDRADIERLDRIAQLRGTTREQLILDAIAAIETPPHRDCESCGRTFAVHDARMRFCSPRCASRERMRKTRAARALNATQEATYAR